MDGDGQLGRKHSEETKQKISKARKGKYSGYDCYASIPVICDNIEYPSITDFCNRNNLGRGMVEKWLKGKSAMQKEWFDKGLRYKNLETNIRCQEKTYANKIFYDNKVYNSQAELARHLNISPSLICIWLKNPEKIPTEIKNKNLESIK